MLRDLPGWVSEPGKPRERFVQLTATRDHLRFVFMTRSVLLLAVCAGIGFALAQEGVAFVSPRGAAVVALALTLNGLTWLRLQQPAPVSYHEFLMQILADVMLLSAALCFSGGDASPYHDLYFVPLTIAAATLPWRHALIAVLAIIALRELACVYYVSLAGLVSPDHELVELLTGALIAYFVFSMARTSRRHEQQLAEIRENYLRERHSAELGSLAAAAADQLSSPLATMAVVVGELRDGVEGPAERRRALEIVAKQIETCKQISSRLLASAGNGRAEGGGRVSADKFCAGIADKCNLMQPWMSVQCRYRHGPSPAPEILADASLEQAILVLLRSDAGAARQVELSAAHDDTRLELRLCARAPRSAADADPGAPLFARARLAPADRLDLLMAKSTIARFGGSVREAAHQDGQVCVELSLALSGVLVRGS